LSVTVRLSRVSLAMGSWLLMSGVGGILPAW
jgi:hypothetical protein